MKYELLVNHIMKLKEGVETLDTYGYESAEYLKKGGINVLEGLLNKIKEIDENYIK